ncbi:MAG: hypothetical protein COV29_03335 [Candidatus Yanofskybacteria bacterium CG10_big_fil_rev_8_21_14_0_10_36_16]|uniref:Peptidase C39-like domain-containing protein n=1 Tax=Candidatus Yanofskybacteria bacterium CG10_big_fil_rev_8_21_14_0_10_36_16 TaxID=1975096 RepID=A0A2J0Q708_9BACT|nr:MAG: hypothetical protein COV29_03335 [Candidatus Yanofskybacteria bacterium CG10_big_fil_rev_8_21_14_0_10_36_16]
MKNKKVIKILLIILLPALAGYFLYISFNVNVDDQKVALTPSVNPQLTPVFITPRITSMFTPVPTPTPEPGSVLMQNVPFTPQAPFGEWSDQRQQDACEESSVLMAVSWARGENFNLDEALNKILAVSDWEKENYGSFQDTSAEDTIERIIKGYFKYHNVRLVKNVKLDDLIRELEDGNIIISPMNGQLLGNPYFTSPGPERHMLVVIGYDYNTEEFITNDPGTRHGEEYRYDRHIFFNAIRDYTTGEHEPIIGVQKNFIVVEK